MLLGVTVVDPDGVVSQQTHLMHRYAPTLLTTTPPLERYRYFLPLRELPRLARQLTGLSGQVAMLGPGSLHHLTAVAVAALGSRARCGMAEGEVSAARNSATPGAVGQRQAAGVPGTEGLCLVVFDAHPDWGQAPPGYVHCGSWVREVLAMPHVRRVVLVGTGLVGAMGLLKPSLLRQVGAAWRAGRLHLFPALACTARELQEALGLDVPPVSLEEGARPTLDRLAALVGDGPVYISVDKDVLHPDQLPGLWPGGFLEVDQLVGLVEGLVKRVGQSRLVGADICGECQGWLSRGPLWLATEAHEAVNLKLLSALILHGPDAVPKRPARARHTWWVPRSAVS